MNAQQLPLPMEFLGTEMQVLRETEEVPVEAEVETGTRKKRKRIEHDAYYTDPAVAEFLLTLLFEREGLSCPRLAL